MKIATSPYHTAPRDDPRIYPGALPDFPYIFAGDEILPLKVDDKHYTVDGLDVDAYLGERGAVPLAARHPVLAIGSNGNPAQLQRKYGDAAIIPVLTATVQNLDVGYSCHMSTYGAIPATPIAAEGASITAHVCLLDVHQLEDMDHTEDLNYNRIILKNDRFPVTLPNGQTFSHVDVYRSRWGICAWLGDVYRLDAIPAQGSDFIPANQMDMLKRLILGWNMDFPAQAFASVDDLLHKRTPGLIAQIKAWMYPRFSVADGLD